MQDRYAGDVGDFGKFALLRALTPGRRLGVCWYRTDGANERNNDGGLLGYLDQVERFRHLDPEAFDVLRGFIHDVSAGRRERSVMSLEELGLIPRDSIFHREFCPGSAATRRAWALRMVEAMKGAALVLLDPDNGLGGDKADPKRVSIAELCALRRPGRVLLLYNHHWRYRSTATVLEAVGGRLSRAGFSMIEAIRLRPYSSRFYVVLDGDEEVCERLERFVERWGEEAQLFRHLA